MVSRPAWQRAATRQAMKLSTWLYRVSEGRIGGRMRGAPVLLLTTTGRKSGKEWTTPLIYGRDGDRLLVIASYGGSDNHPGWWLNLRGTPKATVQVGKDRFPVVASEATGEERERLWQVMTGLYADYDEYVKKTTRTIPLVILDRPAESAS